MPKPKPKPRSLMAYEVVNRADPTKIDRIDLSGDHDYDGRVLDGLLRQMNVENWYVRSCFDNGTTDEDD